MYSDQQLFDHLMILILKMLMVSMKNSHTIALNIHCTLGKHRHACKIVFRCYIAFVVMVVQAEGCTMKRGNWLIQLASGVTL